MLLRRPGHQAPPAPGPVLRAVEGERWALQYRTVHGHRRAFGHSLGGGVVIQFAYQYPERTERLVLVGAGGSPSR